MLSRGDVHYTWFSENYHIPAIHLVLVKEWILASRKKKCGGSFLETLFVLSLYQALKSYIISQKSFPGAHYYLYWKSNFLGPWDTPLMQHMLKKNNNKKKNQSLIQGGLVNGLSLEMSPGFQSSLALYSQQHQCFCPLFFFLKTKLSPLLPLASDEQLQTYSIFMPLLYLSLL